MRDPAGELCGTDTWSPTYRQLRGRQSDQVNKNHVSVGLGAGRRGL